MNKGKLCFGLFLLAFCVVGVVALRKRACNASTLGSKSTYCSFAPQSFVPDFGYKGNSK
jgi:hypothetical protein